MGAYQSHLLRRWIFTQHIIGGVENLLIGKSLAEYEPFVSTYQLQDTELEKPTQRQIALMHRYIAESIGGYTKLPHWNEIANSFGFTSPNSGNKIYHHYNKLKFKTDRINYRNSKKDLTAVIKMLSEYPEARRIAEDELQQIPSD